MPGPEVRLRPIGGRFNVHPDDLRRKLSRVEFQHALGEPAQLNVDLDIWSPDNRDYDYVAAGVLDHHDGVELWLDETCHALLYVEEDDVDYGADGTTRSVVAYDALRRLNRTSASRVYQGVTNHADVVVALAQEHGLLADADPSEMRRLSPAVDVFKKLGDTDLQLATRLAMAEGLGLPWIRYDPARNASGAVIPVTSAAIAGDEKLVIRRMVVGTAERPAFDLAVARPNDDGDLASFRPRFDSGDLPEAVEVVGWDPVSRTPFRVTVVATAAGARIEDEDSRDLTPEERRTAGRESAILRLLGGAREQAHTGILHRVRGPGGRRRTTRAKKEYRDILSEETVSGVHDARAFALAWMNQRIWGYATCEGTILPNMGRAGELRCGHVVFVHGCLPKHEGWYLVTKIHHLWDDGGHTASFHGRRLLTEVQVKASPFPQLEGAA